MERDTAAAAWVRQAQAATGFEHVVIFGSDGVVVYAGTSGLRARVGVPRGTGSDDAVMHHSHPDEQSLSAADFHVAWLRSPGSEVWAHTPDGSTFAGRALSDPAMWRSDRKRAGLRVASELRVLSRRDQRLYIHLAAHLANAEMERMGLVWYRAGLAAGAQDDLRRLSADLPGLQAVVRSEFENAG